MRILVEIAYQGSKFRLSNSTEWTYGTATI